MDITDRKRAEEELVRSREELRGLAAFVENARESERTRLAREMHDQLGQQLAALAVDLSWSLHHVDERAEARRARLAGMQSVLAQTLQSVRRIASELRPGVLDDLGLPAAVHWLAEQFERTSGQAARVTIDQLPAFSPEASTTVFRILQESLTNVVRHAGTAVEIVLAHRGAWFELEVLDRGIGVAPRDEDSPSDRFGVLGMVERAQAWGGSVVVEPRREGGTRVLLRLPMQKLAEGTAE